MLPSLLSSSIAVSAPELELAHAEYVKELAKPLAVKPVLVTE
jgi:hypothetical protein